MTEAKLLLRAFRQRLAEVHLSEVNTASRHDPLSSNAIMALGSIMADLPQDVPIILETMIDQGQSDIPTEIQRTREILDAVSV
jgi:hypothetical protein